jgi:hypothetical protein
MVLGVWLHNTSTFEQYSRFNNAETTDTFLMAGIERNEQTTLISTANKDEQGIANATA